MKDQRKKLKVAVLHAFFRPKGGGEKLVFDIRNHFQADLFTGAIDLDIWSPELIGKDSFVSELYNPKYKLTYLHRDSKLPIWKKIYRQLQFKYNPKIQELNNYDLVIFSGNIANVASKLDPQVKKVMYCHTPPRPFTDRLPALLETKPKFLHPLIRWFARVVIQEYSKELASMDMIITNSINIQNRLKKFTGFDSEVIYPAIKTSRFRYIETGDYFLSYARLEDMKRIRLLIEAFASMPNKQLVICSSGPLKNWIIDQIKTRNLKNISFEGLVTDERLQELVGKCLAGIYIPVEEDAGIIQCELMAAGKPVIGVAEGGLLESIVDGVTGFLLPANPNINDLIQAVSDMSKNKALTMKTDCIIQAQQFDESVFYKKMDKVVKKITS